MSEERKYETFEVKHLGQIAEGKVEFGDITILTGPQASGKSIFLQTFKLVKDAHIIVEELFSRGYGSASRLAAFIKDFQEPYFGTGYSKMINSSTSIVCNGKHVLFNETVGAKDLTERVFFVPAQRVSVLRDGFPGFFTDFNSEPYVLKRFSSLLNLFLNRQSQAIFSSGFDRFFMAIKSPFYPQMARTIYRGANLGVVRKENRRRLTLNIKDADLHPTSWSTGQREFTPLSIGLEYITAFVSVPPEYIVIEEPEMGLHAEAIVAVMLLMLDLASRGYKVVISTHSSIPLEALWAIQRIVQREKNEPEKYIAQLFMDEEPDAEMLELFKKVAQMSLRSYYFDNKAEEGTVIRDISNLSPDSENEYEADLGGLTSFASRASHVVSGLPFPDDDDDEVE